MTVVIDAPVSVVFGFHEREDALALLSPAFPPVRLIGRTSGIEAGARVELRVGGMKWVARHTAYEKDRLFVDEQIEGPFAKWVHRHEFENVAGKTRLTDRVLYLLPGGPLINSLLSEFTNAGLRRMFRHRHGVTKRMCESE
ncbi:MAG: SRPBCC family protein [Acidipila sp.]|nr:SRPBCC family protein [Acidipila sp.]